MKYSRNNNIILGFSMYLVSCIWFQLMQWIDQISNGRTIHPKYKISYSTEFVQNSLSFKMGICFLTSNLMKAVRGQKH